MTINRHKTTHTPTQISSITTNANPKPPTQSGNLANTVRPVPKHVPRPSLGVPSVLTNLAKGLNAEHGGWSETGLGGAFGETKGSLGGEGGIEVESVEILDVHFGNVGEFTISGPVSGGPIRNGVVEDELEFGERVGL